MQTCAWERCRKRLPSPASLRWSTRNRHDARWYSTSDTINALPATRSYGALLNAIPGLSTNTGSTSAMATPDMTFFTANGGRQNGGQVQIDGMPVAASFNGGGVSTFTYDIANAAEMQVLVSGGLGEAENGEPRINLVPQSGGNTFRGQGFYSGAGKWSASNNITPALQAANITAPPTIIKLWDLSGSASGPLLRDRLWFFGNVRQYGNYQTVEGVVGNRFAGDASHWDYEADSSIQARTANSRDIFSGRLTAQVTDRNRVTFFHEYQHRCSGSTFAEGSGCRSPGQGWTGLGTNLGATPSSPEAWPGYHDFPYYVTQIGWTAPLSSKLLVDAGFSRFHYLWAGFGQAPPDRVNLIPVTETQGIDGHRANFSYRGIYDPIAYAYADNDANPNNWKASLSYVTGAHNMKFGYQGSYQRSLQGREANTTLLRYVFNNRQPNGFGFYLTPRWEVNDRTATQSLYAQDQWTLGRLTVQGAIRYDRAWSWAPSEHNGSTQTSQFMPNPITFPRTVSVAGYNDITTRWGAAWDVFGTGRTALKANIGKYLQTATNDENYAVNNPAGLSRFVTFVTNRSWIDGDNDRVIDCNLMNFAAQSPAATGSVDTCGALSGNNLNFGNPNPNATVVNPDILKGWGVRPADWGYNVSVQQEVLPRVSVEVGYNRRWFQNFFVTDNRAVSASDYTPWTFTAPQDQALPGGGGYPIDLQVITSAAALRPAQNYITFESDYGDERAQDLARGDRFGHCAICLGADRSGRDDDRPWRPRPLRHCRRSAGGISGRRRITDRADRHLQGDRTVADLGPWPRQLHRALGRRPRERQLPLAESRQRVARACRERLGHQRRVAERERLRSKHSHPGITGAAARDGARQWRHDDQSSASR